MAALRFGLIKLHPWNVYSIIILRIYTEINRKDKLMNMTQRTCNIIMACKGRICKEEKDALTRVKHYMAEECGCSLDAYTEDRINGIMLDAMCDYLDTCDRPSAFIKSLSDIAFREKYTRGEQIASAFELVQVKNDGQYINGFSETLCSNSGSQS